MQEAKGFVPAFQITHIIALATVLTANMAINGRLLGLFGSEQTISSLYKRFYGTIWIGLVVLAITGSGLILAEPARSLLSMQFKLKMVLLAAVIVLTIVVERFVARRAEQWDMHPVVPTGTKIAAVLATLAWFAIIFCGRWIAYA